MAIILDGSAGITSPGWNLTSTFTLTNQVISGNLTLSSSTANGVLYANGSNLVTSGSALSFDGTNLATTGKIGAGSSAGLYTQIWSTGNIMSADGSQIGFLANSAGAPANYMSGSNTSNYLSWTVNNSERMRINSSGLLIIGSTSASFTNSTSAQLNVKSSTNLGLVTTDITTATVATFAATDPGSVAAEWGTGIAIKPLFARGATAWIGAVEAGSNKEGAPHMVFRLGSYDTSTSEYVRINSSGNLLIGYTAAQTNGILQVNGSIGIAANNTVRQATNGDGGTLKFYGTQFVSGQNNSHSYGYTGGAGIASVSPSSSYVTLDVGGYITGQSHRLKVVNDGTGITGYLYYGQEGGSTATLYANVASGNVGIGTSTPSSSLDIGSRTDAIVLPKGTTAQRPGSPVAGMTRFNSDLKGLDFYDGTSWQNISYSDPNWANVVLYLRGGSLTDLKGRHSVSALNVSTATTPGKPFAAAPSTAWYLINNGTNNYLDITSNLSDFGPVNYTNFTIEFWLYSTQSGSGYGHFYNIGGQSNQGVIKFATSPSSYGLYWYTSNGELINWGATGTVFAGQWAYMVYEKYGSTNTTWVNGVRISQNTNSFPAGTPAYLRLGGPFNTEYSGHYFDELRVTTAARYGGVATIPVQTSPWPTA